jgi:hypothetical protein
MEKLAVLVVVVVISPPVLLLVLSPAPEEQTRQGREMLVLLAQAPQFLML